MFDIRVFNALATQTSIKIGQISFNVTTPTGKLKAEGQRRLRESTFPVFNNRLHTPGTSWGSIKLRDSQDRDLVLLWPSDRHAVNPA